MVVSALQFYAVLLWKAVENSIFKRPIPSQSPTTSLYQLEELSINPSCLRLRPSEDTDCLLFEASLSCTPCAPGKATRLRPFPPLTARLGAGARMNSPIPVASVAPFSWRAVWDWPDVHLGGCW